MLSIISQTKYALYSGGTKISEYIYNCCKENNEYCILYNREILVIYDKITGQKTFEVKDYEDFVIDDKYIKVQKGNNWGLYDFSGNEIVPMQYYSIDEYIYSPTTVELMAVDVETEYETGGYYILSNKTYYEAEKINITKTNRIELLIDKKWTMIE